MPEELITVLTVNYNTAAFIEISLYALAKLTRHKYKVIICDNGSARRDRKKLRSVARRYENVELIFRRQTAPGSIGHGEALNLLIDRIDTPYGAILDADATFLIKDWDEILISQLDDKVKMIGTPPMRGKPFRPADFPLCYATLFDARVFKSLGIDMRPGDPATGQDTGWEIGNKFLKAGYRGKVLEARNTRRYKEGAFKEVICAEYYAGSYTDIFASHYGRGSTLGAAKYNQWNRLLSLPVINSIARRVKGWRERNKWLHICRGIIERQCAGR